jgi:putative transcriptional regulator
MPNIVVIDVKTLRQRLKLTQMEFALRYGFNLTTLRQWEQGRRNPDEAARAFLRVISHSPDVVSDALRAAS